VVVGISGEAPLVLHNVVRNANQWSIQATRRELSFILRPARCVGLGAG
jgi:hypothetical protein